MMTYQVEKFTNLIQELKIITEKHYDELSLFNKKIAPFDPDWELYEKMDNAGFILTYTVRNNQKKLVGYHIMFIMKHLHYKQTIMSDCDVFYLLPEYRKGFCGYKLLSGIKEELKKIGVKIIIFSDNNDIPLGPIAKRLGYKPLGMKYFMEV